VILDAPGSLFPVVFPEPDQIQDEFKGLEEYHKFHRTPPSGQRPFPVFTDPEKCQNYGRKKIDGKPPWR